jgi:hypothetical protein
MRVSIARYLTSGKFQGVQESAEQVMQLILAGPAAIAVESAAPATSLSAPNGGSRRAGAPPVTPSHVARRFPDWRRILSLRSTELHRAALLPVAASTTTAPVMCGCTEQKYS